MSDLLTALGLVLVIEGLLYAGLPSVARRMAETVQAFSDSDLRTTGLVAIVIGFGVVWAVRTFA
ncbi:MAG: DUF2065 domain-containing protein [Pseudomonadota bacterium]